MEIFILVGKKERRKGMKPLRKYVVYLDDGEFIYKLYVPAINEEAAKTYCEGNGDIVAVKDVTEEFPILADCVAAALKNYGFGETEMDLILRTLQSVGMTE